jgi:hypothetical protein
MDKEKAHKEIIIDSLKAENDALRREVERLEMAAEKAGNAHLSCKVLLEAAECEVELLRVVRLIALEVVEMDRLYQKKSPHPESIYGRLGTALDAYDNRDKETE